MEPDSRIFVRLSVLYHGRLGERRSRQLAREQTNDDEAA
jgi:hypothetical protein